MFCFQKYPRRNIRNKYFKFWASLYVICCVNHLTNAREFFENILHSSCHISTAQRDSSLDRGREIVYIFFYFFRFNIVTSATFLTCKSRFRCCFWFLTNRCQKCLQPYSSDGSWLWNVLFLNKDVGKYWGKFRALSMLYSYGKRDVQHKRLWRKRWTLTCSSWIVNTGCHKLQRCDCLT